MTVELVASRVPHELGKCRYGYSLNITSMGYNCAFPMGSPWIEHDSEHFLFFMMLVGCLFGDVYVPTNRRCFHHCHGEHVYGAFTLNMFPLGVGGVGYFCLSPLPDLEQRDELKTFKTYDHFERT